MPDNEKTTIQVDIETRSRLEKLGVKGESYDDVIRRLLDELKSKSKAG
jgi:predicted CopG family antitoxin